MLESQPPTAGREGRSVIWIVVRVGFVMLATLAVLAVATAGVSVVTTVAVAGAVLVTNLGL
jgi:hypothetical protein